MKIPGAPVGYSFPLKVFDLFCNCNNLSKIAITRLGMTTANNELFVRLWHEVNSEKVCWDGANAEKVKQANVKWIPYNKGGAYRKWYGNNDYLVNWENDGYAIKHYGEDEGHIRSTVPNTEYCFRPCITWSKVSSGNIAFRYRKQGSIFDVAGACMYTSSDDLRIYLLGFLNTKMVQYLLAVLSPTLNYEGGHISALPVIDCNGDGTVTEMVERNICLSREDWDSFETSWDFKKHPMI